MPADAALQGVDVRVRAAITSGGVTSGCVNVGTGLGRGGAGRAGGIDGDVGEVPA